MSNVLTSTRMLKTIRRRAFIPDDKSTFTDEDLLEMLDEEINMFGVEQLLRTYEEYLVEEVDIPLEHNKFEYEIPYRAIGNKLREVALIDTSGNIFELSRVRLDELFDYRSGHYNWHGHVFYMKGNKVHFVNEVPSSTGSLRMYFYMRPNTMVKEDDAGKISNIDRDNGIITLNNFPTDFTNLPATKCDFVKYQSPNIIIGWDEDVISVNKTAKSVTLSPDSIPSDLQVGDYLCEKQETPVPQLPAELHPILAQRVAISCLEAMGDTEGRQLAADKLTKMERSVLTIINNRVDGANEKINNRHSPLSQRRYGYNKRGI